MSAPRDPQELAAAIEALLDDIAASAGERARGAAEDLVRRLMQFYGAGLEQLMATLDAAGGPDLQRRVAANPLVGALLALHDLHPVELTTRLRYAVDTARRRLGAHGVGIELTGVDGDGMVRVRSRAGAGSTRCATWSRPRWPRRRRTPQGSCSTGRARSRRCCRSGCGHRRRSGDPVPAALPAEPDGRGGARRSGASCARRRSPREHPHLVEPAERRLLCACTACGVLFSEPGLRYRRVPDRYLYDTGFRAVRHAVGRAAGAGRDGVLPGQLDPREQSSPATRARRGRPRASCRSRRGRTGWGRPRSPD